MYDYLKGKIVEIAPTHVVLDVGGIGYFIHISLNTFTGIKDEVDYKLFTSFQVRDDGHYLYGFADRLERDLFQQLISVAGIGPSTGRMILSSLDPAEINQAIISGDVPTLKRIKGIGPKSAQRIILELQDKLKKQNLELSVSSIGGGATRKISAEAVAALVMLGFQRNAVEKMVSGIISDKPEATVEELIKAALNKL